MAFSETRSKTSRKVKAGTLVNKEPTRKEKGIDLVKTRDSISSPRRANAGRGVVRTCVSPPLACSSTTFLFATHHHPPCDQPEPMMTTTPQPNRVTSGSSTAAISGDPSRLSSHAQQPVPFRLKVCWRHLRRGPRYMRSQARAARRSSHIDAMNPARSDRRPQRTHWGSCRGMCRITTPLARQRGVRQAQHNTLASAPSLSRVCRHRLKCEGHESHCHTCAVRVLSHTRSGAGVASASGLITRRAATTEEWQPPPAVIAAPSRVGC